MRRVTNSKQNPHGTTQLGALNECVRISVSVVPSAWQTMQVHGLVGRQIGQSDKVDTIVFANTVVVICILECNCFP